MPALQGEEAVSHLKDRGPYNSLQRATDSLRYLIEWRDRALADGGGAYGAGNARQNYRAVFTGQRVGLFSGDDEGRSWRLGLRLAGYGYGDRLLKPVAGPITAERNRVEISKTVGTGQASAMGDRCSSLTEWYLNTPDGLEQGFTLARAPGERRDGERLNLRIDVDGDLKARPADQGRAVDLIGAAGARSLRYDHLRAYDAAGRELVSRMRVESGQIWLEVDEQDAVYPVTIDPTFSQQQKLTAPDGAAGDFFGGAVAISGDTAIVAAGPAGAVYVFVRANGGPWTLQQKLVVGPGFGYSVAISGDTIVAGFPSEDSEAGSAYVFVRSGGVWSQQQRLIASDSVAGNDFGISVGISGDTVVVGARFSKTGPHPQQGSAYVLVRASGAWSEQQHLTATDGGVAEFYGDPVAISGDTVVIGAAATSAEVPQQEHGSTYVYVRASGIWSLQQQLVSGVSLGENLFGSSVAIESDIVVVGAIFGNAAYVFERTGATWGPAQPLSGGLGDFGISASVSGGTVVVGCRNQSVGGNFGQGAAFVYSKELGQWGERQMLTASDGAVNDRFGYSAAISGETIVVGSPFSQVGENATQGSAYIFSPNTAPKITASPVTVQQGRVLTGASIGTVSDNETPAGQLTVTVAAGGTATGVTLTNITNSGGVITADLAASCTAVSGTVRLLVTDGGGLTATANLQVNVTPSDPPLIACPGNLTIVTAHPGDATAVVSYPPPLVTGACPVTVVCTPPSGSAFPAGVTTVTCTATDASGNKATCAFQVTVFNYCLQDNTTGNILQWSSTGNYIFTRCADKFTLTGTGTVRNVNGLNTLSASLADRRISAIFNLGSLTGRATIMLTVAPGVYQTIIVSQTNPSATCACP